VELPDFAI